MKEKKNQGSSKTIIDIKQTFSTISYHNNFLSNGSQIN